MSNKAFIKAMKKNIKRNDPVTTPPTTQHELSPDHPFYSQYNKLKLTNIFEKPKDIGHVPSQCKRCQARLSAVHKDEFYKQCKYSLLQNTIQDRIDDHQIRTGIVQIGEIIREGVPQSADANTTWRMLRNKERELRRVSEARQLKSPLIAKSFDYQTS